MRRCLTISLLIAGLLYYPSDAIQRSLRDFLADNIIDIE